MLLLPHQPSPRDAGVWCVCVAFQIGSSPHGITIYTTFHHFLPLLGIKIPICTIYFEYSWTFSLCWMHYNDPYRKCCSSWTAVPQSRPTRDPCLVRLDLHQGASIFKVWVKILVTSLFCSFCDRFIKARSFSISFCYGAVMYSCNVHKRFQKGNIVAISLPKLFQRILQNYPPKWSRKRVIGSFVR